MFHELGSSLYIKPPGAQPNGSRNSDMLSLLLPGKYTGPAKGGAAGVAEAHSLTFAGQPRAH